MSKKKKTYHQNLLFAFKVVDSYDYFDSQLLYESPWYQTEDEANTAIAVYKKANGISSDGFYTITPMRKLKDAA